MILVNRIRLAVSTLMLASMITLGCTTNEPQQDAIMDDESRSETESRLIAGIEPLSVVNNQGKEQLSVTSLVFFVNNRTQTDQTFLVWNTPFENPLSANLFRIQLNGEVLAYQGRLVKRGSPTAEHYQTIAAGEIIKTVVDLSNYYDMSLQGTYEVQLVSSTTESKPQQDDQTPIIFLQDSVTIVVP